MSAPAVSVVVTTWNRVGLLSETLQSVLTQTVADIEVIVVDNESDDGTSQYVEGIGDARVHYVRHGNGGVVAVNRNLGVSRSTGAWVAFCDDDDLWAPDKLERQLSAAEAFPDASAVTTDAVYFSSDEGTGAVTEYGSLVDRTGDGWVTFDDLVSRQRTQVVLSSAMVRREVFDSVGEWSVDPDVFAVEDLQYWLRMTAAGLRIRHLDLPLVRFRVHPASASAADTRVTALKCLRMADGLFRDGVLDESRYQVARRAFLRRARVAALKESLKRVPGLKALVYRNRATAASRSGASRPGGER